jgi:parallel beta-helix repeat protein
MNGITGGTGTAVDPYVIQGWSIASGSNSAISVTGTRAHFLIKDCVLSRGPVGSAYGITLVRTSNATIQNVSLEDMNYGQSLQQSRDIAIEHCSFSSTSVGLEIMWDSASVRVSHNVFDDSALELDHAGNVSIDNNSFEGPFSIWYSNDVAVSNNTISGRGGLEVYTSGTIVLKDNRFDNCTFQTYGSLKQFETLVIDGTNTVNARPVLCLKDQDNLSIDAHDYGQVICVNISDSVIKNFQGPTFPDPNGTGTDTILAYSANVSITESQFTNRWLGVDAHGCTNVSVSACLFRGGTMGVLLGLCERCVVRNNEFTEIRQGVNVGTSNYVRVEGNHFSGRWEGVYLFNTQNVTVAENTFTTEQASIRFEGVRHGVTYNNNFMTGSVEFFPPNSDLSFINNYWAGSKPKDANGDGFADEPMVLGQDPTTKETFMDQYPLMRPYGASSGVDPVFLILAICGVIVVGAVSWIVIRRKLRGDNGQKPGDLYPPIRE